MSSITLFSQALIQPLSSLPAQVFGPHPWNDHENLPSHQVYPFKAEAAHEELDLWESQTPE